MSTIDDAFERIIKHKANLIKNGNRYENYIKSVLNKKGILKKHGIKDSEKMVKVLVKVFKMGAVDGMIYDIAAALDFTKQKRRSKLKDSVADWTSFKKREEILLELFCEVEHFGQ